jgi:hypothetical protein
MSSSHSASGRCAIAAELRRDGFLVVANWRSREVREVEELAEPREELRLERADGEPAPSPVWGTRGSTPDRR